MAYLYGRFKDWRPLSAAVIILLDQSLILALREKEIGESFLVLDLQACDACDINLRFVWRIRENRSDGRFDDRFCIIDAKRVIVVRRVRHAPMWQFHRGDRLHLLCTP